MNILKNRFYNGLFKQFIYFTVFLSLFLIFGQVVNGQTAGEYRSVSTGNWITLASWQRYNGTFWATPTTPEGYPGQYTGTGTVTIQSPHIITIGNTGISNQPMGVLVIESGGQLYLTGSNPNTITFNLNTPIISVVAPSGSIYFKDKVKLVIAQNGVMFASLNGLLGTCNNNVEVWIGTVQFAACSGAPGNLFTFGQIMASVSGGTLNAVPSSNSPVCEDGTINLTGTYTGAIGTVPTYSWKIIAPGGGVTIDTNQNLTISSAVIGTYSVTLTVSTTLSGTTYTNAETILVLVNPLPTLTGATQAANICDGSNAIINLTGLVPNSTFTVNYSINNVAQTPIAGLTASVSGTSGFTTPSLSFANDGQTLQITGITITSSPTNCFKTFSQNVTLAVWQAGSWLGNTNSDWNTASNWCGGVPTATSNIFIRSTALYQPIIGVSGGVCQNITINSGASLTINSSNILTINGNWINNGIFTTNTGTLIFNGTTTITGSSANSFYNVTINSTKSLTASSGNINIGGNFSNNGSFIHNSGMLTFNGSGSQTINSGGSSFNDITILNTTGSCTISTNDITILGTFSTNVGTILNMSTKVLSVNNVSHSGILYTENTSANPFSIGKTWGGTVVFSGSSSQNIVSGIYNNLTFSGMGGATATNNITVNGILNLSASNPSSVKGILDMNIFTLYMGSSATTTGTADVTGIVNRTSFIAGVSYTFGNQYSIINFQNVGTLPSQISVKITLGSSPVWYSSAINRYYEIIQTGAISALANIALRYLDTELNGNAEANLVYWTYNSINLFLAEQGKASNNNSENWVSYSNMEIDNLPSAFGNKYYTLANNISPYFLWNGSISNNWENQSNWSQNSIPGLTDKVIIPDTIKSYFDPALPMNTSIQSLKIEQGGILNSVSLEKLTLNGSDSSWCNMGGMFNYGTTNVSFTNSNASIYGKTDFFNLNVENGSVLEMTSNSYIKIWGDIINNGVINTENSQYNTIEYAAGNQNIVITNPTSFKYCNLIISGSSTKTLPAQTMEIRGNFNILGTNNVNSEANLRIGGNLTIANGCNLTIKSNKTISISGSIYNDAGTNGLVLQSDASGTASLIHNSNNVQATVKRYITGIPEAWHFLSSPVAAQSISGTWLPSGSYGNGTGYDLYVWNEPTNCWIYKLDLTSAINWNTVHPGNQFVIGRAYLYSLQAANPTKEFEGNLNNASVNYPITANSTNSNLKGFNLIGNPYPSSIDWQSLSGWSRSDLINSGGGYDMWIWNESAGNYGVCNSSSGSVGTNNVTRYIAPMQGFFVQAATSNGSISIDNLARVHNGAGNWFKNYKNNQIYLNAIVQSESDNSYDEARIVFANTSQHGATKLFSHKTTAPGLYFHSGNNYLSVKYLLDTIDNPVVPMMFKSGKDGNYILKFEFENENFDIAMLEDCKTNYIQNLKLKKTYRFKSSTNDEILRFKLHFDSDINAYYNDLPARIYSDGICLNIDLTLIGKDTEILIYDSFGRLLLQKTLVGLKEHKLSINADSQILIVKLINPQGNKCQKVLFN